MDIIDWSQVNWIDVGVYAGLAFIASLIGMGINRALGDTLLFAAILTTILFSVGYVGWNYYPHGIDVGQTHIVGQTVNPAVSAPAPAAEPAAQAPADSSPVTTVPATEPASEQPASEPASEPATEPAPANQ